MHRLNFCGTLCLPNQVEGYPSRGMNVVKDFEEGAVIPMAKPAATRHILYSSRPVEYNLKTDESRILQAKDLDSEDKISALLANPDMVVGSPDHALDTDSRLDAVFSRRDENLRHIVDRLFTYDQRDVLIFINNGIGTNGIVRDENGLAYAVKKDGKIFDQHQKGLPGSYQNSAHEHIHVMPASSELDSALFSGLKELHKHYSSHWVPLNDRISGVRDGELPEFEAVPCIAISFIEYGANLNRELLFGYFPANDLIGEQKGMAGIARNLLQAHSESQGMSFEKEDVRDMVSRTADFYAKILS
ncbi:hypothetical protein HOG16_00820 [Candidatus Woesearchaeota archaeon]|jgi:hypothetical protein|nr:hypothetical protein [Candidatus Woesearchaeota archaeon]MBT4322105.1 hypothetical protein [Candidatus Woesearchaeota archaeon]MBT4630682.1 hypothetical protein [Candidatus Woesearchaeota archaeon]